MMHKLGGGWAISGRKNHLEMFFSKLFGDFIQENDKQNPCIHLRFLYLYIYTFWNFPFLPVRLIIGASPCCFHYIPSSRQSPRNEGNRLTGHHHCKWIRGLAISDFALSERDGPSDGPTCRYSFTRTTRWAASCSLHVVVKKEVQWTKSDNEPRRPN